MLLIKTRLAPSPIHGMGLFAAEPVPKGTAFWRFEAGFDRSISPEWFATLPVLTQDHIRCYAYRSRGDGHYILSGDFCCFMNHDPDPNTGAPAEVEPPVTTIALRDIAQGEELTCNYFSFDAEAGNKLRMA